LQNPENLPEVNHIDACRSNNVIENLEWITSSGNRYHAYEVGGLCAKGEGNGYSKLNNEKVLKIRASSNAVESLALEFLVSKATIKDVLSRRTWRHI